MAVVSVIVIVIKNRCVVIIIASVTIVIVIAVRIVEVVVADVNVSTYPYVCEGGNFYLCPYLSLGAFRVQLLVGCFLPQRFHASLCVVLNTFWGASAHGQNKTVLQTREQTAKIYH